MNSELYELERNKSRYNNLKENIKCSINVLSKTSFKDNLSLALSSAKNNYTINEECEPANTIQSCINTIDKTLGWLNSLYNSVGRALDNTNKLINNYEEE